MTISTVRSVFLAKTGSIDAICFIVQNLNDTCEGIAQLYRSDGKIIFECRICADGTKGRVTRELMQFLGGIEAPKIGYFGHKKTAIKEIQALLKPYDRRN